MKTVIFSASVGSWVLRCVAVSVLGCSGAMNSTDIPINYAHQTTSAPRSPSTSQTGLLLDDVYLGHLSGNTGHPERPERLVAIRNGLEKQGLLKDVYRITPRRATDDELALVHTRSYLDLVRRE